MMIQRHYSMINILGYYSIMILYNGDIKQWWIMFNDGIVQWWYQTMISYNDHNTGDNDDIKQW